MLMIRPRGRLVHCVVLLIVISCGFPGLLRSDSAAPKAKPVRIDQDSKDGSVRPIKAGVVHVYKFNLKPGEYVHFVVDQDGADVKAEVFANGEFLFDVDSLNGRSGPEEVPLLATGTAMSFGVEVSIGKGEGNYRPQLKGRREATERDAAWFNGTRAYWRGRKASSVLEKETSLRDAARLWDRAGHLLGRADALQKLAILYEEEPDRKEDALKVYLEAVPLYERAGSRQVAIVRNELGRIYFDLRRLQLAESSYRSALAFSTEVGDFKEKASALQNLCRLDLARSEFARALASCEEALPLFESLGIVERQVRVLNLMGRLYVDLGQIGRGLEYHRRALTLSRDDELKASTWTHIGDAYYSSGSSPLATMYYEKALRAQRDLKDRRTEAVTLNNLAMAYYQAKRPRDAQAALRRAISLFEQQKSLQWQVASLANLGWVLDELGQSHEAMRTYREALKLARDMKYPGAEVSAFFGMAWSEWRRGNSRSAQDFVTQAIAVVESQLANIDEKDSRITFLAERQNFYDLLVQIRMEQHRRQRSAGHDISAFEASEAARGRSLRETLSGGMTLPRLSLKEIQERVLDPETVLLEYFLGDPESYLFVVTSTEITSYTLASGAVLEGLARKVHRLLPESHKREFREDALQSAKELSRLLLGPVAGRLGNKRLLVVAPPTLQYIAFSALPNPAAPAKPGADWPEPMIERHEIVPLPSAAIIDSLRRARSGRTKASRPLAILGDPVTSPRDERLRGVGQPPRASPELGSLERLKYTEQEVEKIVASFPSGSYFKAQGFDVRRDLVMSGQLNSYEILHLAMHGYLNPREAGLSGLVLSQYDPRGRRIDGLLRARDVQSLDLSADLVVLS
ncbi:MAG TPA: tetratricopeptide repeat protein, partial [Thermoanaerobaculia bacterium]|nr:tetratricopeptide repeat protein [Thermoanaerobaculia bacterium]